jgi:hypothetical protein
MPLDERAVISKRSDIDTAPGTMRRTVSAQLALDVVAEADLLLCLAVACSCTWRAPV